MRVKICRKEAKESGFWLKLTSPNTTEIEQKNELINEVVELRKIFGAMVEKSK